MLQLQRATQELNELMARHASQEQIEAQMAEIQALGAQLQAVRAASESPATDPAVQPFSGNSFRGAASPKVPGFEPW